MALDSRALNTDHRGRAYSSVGGEARTFPGSRRRTGFRRRFVVPVPEFEGVEMLLPAVPVIRQARRFIALMMMAGVFLLGYNLVTSPKYAAGMPFVSGEMNLTDLQVSSISGVRGKSIILIDPEAVKARLESYPEIQSAEVSLRWPNEVQIAIEERLPVVSWSDGGRTWLISTDGVAFLGDNSGEAIPHLVSPEAFLQVSENPLEPVVDPVIIRTVQGLTSILPEVREFTFDHEHGLAFADPRGWQVYLGVGGDFTSKVAVYQALAAHLEAKELTPELVSVEQVTAPYYR